MIIPDSLYFRLLFLGGALACALAVVKPILGFGLIGGVVGICVVLYFVAATLNGRVDPTILFWVLIFPLGYYFLSFPRERSIITLDRVLPVVLFSLGISGAWIGNLTQLAPYKPIFIAATLGFVGTGYWLVYRASRRACADGEACARPLSKRLVAIVFAVATAIVIAAFAFDYLAPYLLS